MQSERRPASQLIANLSAYIDRFRPIVSLIDLPNPFCKSIMLNVCVRINSNHNLRISFIL
jgi:hypothetical protein